MTTIHVSILAGFTSPLQIETNPLSLLWLLPITMAIAVVYKAIKLPTIKTADFLKETLLLFASIAVFMAVTALFLYALEWLIIE